MPTTTMEHEDPWKFDEGELYPANLTKVTETTRTITRGDRKGEDFTKWEWEFTISEGQHAGLRAWGETDSKMSSHPANKCRPWAEALRGDVPFAVGEGLNTDDLIGLPCYLQVRHVEYTKSDGSPGFKEPVVSVLSEVSINELANEPPF